ncbi:MAG: hypothetical protein BWY83_03072 [bacterium ADurb.Bin478]|nr:MAG: hypothetical protein BWY83_03072 [bacterium ADurb.Bin478]
MQTGAHIAVIQGRPFAVHPRSEQEVVAAGRRLHGQLIQQLKYLIDMQLLFERLLVIDDVVAKPFETDPDGLLVGQPEIKLLRPRAADTAGIVRDIDFTFPEMAGHAAAGAQTDVQLPFLDGAGTQCRRTDIPCAVDHSAFAGQPHLCARLRRQRADDSRAFAHLRQLVQMESSQLAQTFMPLIAVFTRVHQPPDHRHIG